MTNTTDRWMDYSNGDISGVDAFEIAILFCYVVK